MISIKRRSFSIGLLARLGLAGLDREYLERTAEFAIAFSDSRHDHAPGAEGFRKVTDEVTSSIECESQRGTQNMPGVRVGLSGPSVDLVDWVRYLMSKIRRPK